MSRSRGQILLAAAPLAIMAAVALAVVLVRSAAGAVSLVSLGPAFAPLAGELLYTLVTGAVALGLCGGLEVYRHLAASLPGYLALATVAGVSTAGVLASAAIRRRRLHLAQLTAIAEVTQRVLLRPVPQQVGPLTLAVRYLSASSGAEIGGDLYDVAVTPAGLRLIMGDVQGKGLPAVQTAATVLAAFRESAYDAPDLTAIADRIETSLTRHATGDQFVTVLLAHVSADGGKVSLLNCGHPPPLLLSGAAVRFLEPPQASLPLGLAELGQLPGEPVTISLGKGDCLLFYTDGVSEARSKTGEFFPLARSPALAGVTEPAVAMAQLSAELLRHIGHPPDDDAAMLLLRRS